MRRDAREAVYRMLYSFFLSGDVDDELKKYYYFEHRLNGKDVEFADTLFNAVLNHAEELGGYLAAISSGYALDRINYLDRAAIYIAMTEIKYFGDIDTAVSIDEAVRLVKLYSTEKSMSFVNGILAEYAKGQQ